jgi:hypothetical protein|tara:strand:- start:1332 stop:1580 length:249 start_codon:yes stop_codon:yes gene_type:complete
MRKYNITKSHNDFYKVKATDEYGFTTIVYERTKDSASEYLLNWFDKTEDRKKSKELMNKAILNCIELDKTSGILTGNRDNLD